MTAVETDKSQFRLLQRIHQASKSIGGVSVSCVMYYFWSNSPMWCVFDNLIHQSYVMSNVVKKVMIPPERDLIRV